MQYIAYLHKDRNSDFGVSFPDFPGCITAGKTLEEARQLATEALSMHVEGMLEDKQLIPEPSTLDDLAKDPAMKGASPSSFPSNPRNGPSVSTSPRDRASLTRSIVSPSPPE